MQPPSFDFNLQFKSSEVFTIITLLFAWVLSFWFIIGFTEVEPVLLVSIIGNIVGREGEVLPLFELFIVLILVGSEEVIVTIILFTH